MSEFSKYWDDKVKPVIIEYINHDYLEYLYKLNDRGVKPSQEEKEKLKSFGVYDGLTMAHISSMSFSVEHELADGREVMAELAVMQVHNVLASDTFFPNVFGKCADTKEAQQVKKITELLGNLLKCETN